MGQPGKGKTFVAEIDYRNSSGHGMIRKEGGHVDVGRIPENLVGEKIEAVMVTDRRAVIESTSIKGDDGTASEPEVDESDNSESSQISPRTTVSDSEIEALRDQAEDASVEEVPSDSVIDDQTKRQYSRSQEVKEYVKARADGVCEGCEEPAPFTSKTGEPYLHVHHIFELANGGSDTPDTVVALCPNCHYRVHHGQDGDEYNQKLLEKVREFENS